MAGWSICRCELEYGEVDARERSYCEGGSIEGKARIRRLRSGDCFRMRDGVLADVESR